MLGTCRIDFVDGDNGIGHCRGTVGKMQCLVCAGVFGVSVEFAHGFCRFAGAVDTENGIVDGRVVPLHKVSLLTLSRCVHADIQCIVILELGIQCRIDQVVIDINAIN